MSNCIICEKKLSWNTAPIFGMGKTKDGDRVCITCHSKLLSRNSPFGRKASKYSTEEFLEGVKQKKMKLVQEKLNAIDPKLLKMPEAFELPYILTEEEVIERVAIGYLVEKASHSGKGFIVVTDHRVFVLDVTRGSSGMFMEDFPLDKITSISFERGFLKSNIKLICNGNTAIINLLKEGDELCQYIREKINKPKSVHQPVQTTNNDPLEQLKKLKDLLDSGIITPDEFETKKADLLNKI